MFKGILNPSLLPCCASIEGLTRPNSSVPPSCLVCSPPRPLFSRHLSPLLLLVLLLLLLLLFHLPHLLCSPHQSIPFISSGFLVSSPCLFSPLPFFYSPYPSLLLSSAPLLSPSPQPLLQLINLMDPPPQSLCLPPNPHRLL